jgi:hypothetical protein
MGPLLPAAKSKALQQLGDTVFGDQKFDAFKTNVGIVATNYDTKIPRIFKTQLSTRSLMLWLPLRRRRSSYVS